MTSAVQACAAAQRAGTERAILLMWGGVVLSVRDQLGTQYISAQRVCASPASAPQQPCAPLCAHQLLCGGGWSAGLHVFLMPAHAIASLVARVPVSASTQHPAHRACCCLLGGGRPLAQRALRCSCTCRCYYAQSEPSCLHPPCGCMSPCWGGESAAVRSSRYCAVRCDYYHYLCSRRPSGIQPPCGRLSPCWGGDALLQVVAVGIVLHTYCHHAASHHAGACHHAGGGCWQCAAHAQAYLVLSPACAFVSHYAYMSAAAASAAVC